VREAAHRWDKGVSALRCRAGRALDMTSSVRFLHLVWCPSLGRTLLGATLFAALLGCVPIPYGSSEPVPELTPRFPADVLERSDDMLLLTQTTDTGWRDPKNVIDASFVKGYQLKTINEHLTLRSNLMLGLVTLGYGGDVPISNTVLDRICVLVPDGRAITLAFGSGSDQIQALDPNRRRAIVAALSGSDPHPFEVVDGPCGVMGATNWNRNARSRSRIAEYIAALPVAVPAANRSALTRILTAGSTDNTSEMRPPPGVMVLVETAWHGAEQAESPLFLRRVDFTTLTDSLKNSKETDIVRALPSNKSGERALERISLERFCAVSDDGHGVRWRNLSQTWESFDATAQWAPEEISELRSGRAGPACVPDGAGAWSATERSRVIAFLEAVRTTKTHGAARAEARLKDLLLGPKDASHARFLLVAVNQEGDRDLRAVPLLLDAPDATDLVDVLRSIPPADFAGRVASSQGENVELLKDFLPSGLCLISITGDVLRFKPAYAPDWMAVTKWWDPPTAMQYANELASWRDEAIEHLSSDQYELWQPEVCWLGLHKNWPQGLHDAVTRFLERLPKMNAGGRESPRWVGSHAPMASYPPAGSPGQPGAM
jgi:hypothetical protein